MNMRTTSLAWLAILLAIPVAVGMAGCLSDAEVGTGPVPDKAGNGSTRAAEGFVAPHQFARASFEPSIEVGPEGTIYITAPSPGENESRSASWLWASSDDGANWTAPPRHPIHANGGFMEGDVAVDPRGWLYQLDTYFTDNVLGVWSDQARTFEHGRQAQGTPTQDDRP